MADSRGSLCTSGSGMVEVGHDAGAKQAASLRLAVSEGEAMEREPGWAVKSSWLSGMRGRSCLIQALCCKTGVGGTSGAVRALCVLAGWLSTGEKAGCGAAGFETYLYCFLSLPPCKKCFIRQ